MKKLNLPPFYIGQKIVAIRNHKQGRFKQGEIFTVTGITNCPVCGFIKINIGISNPLKLYNCSECGSDYMKENNAADFHPISFRPLDEMKAPMLTFKQIKEVEKEEILILN
jgi:hypothetical protein